MPVLCCCVLTFIGSSAITRDCRLAAVFSADTQPPNMAAQDLVTCGTCKRDVPKESLVQRLLEANRKQCMVCHALKSRIQRLVKADDDGELEALSDLTPETTAQLMKDGENLYGPNLKALLIQAITQSEIESQKSNFAAQGTFEPLKDVEERMKDQPQALASLKANSRIITDPIFQGGAHLGAELHNVVES